MYIVNLKIVPIHVTFNVIQTFLKIQNFERLI